MALPSRTIGNTRLVQRLPGVARARLNLAIFWVDGDGDVVRE